MVGRLVNVVYRWRGLVLESLATLACAGLEDWRAPGVEDACGGPMSGGGTKAGVVVRAGVS